MTYSLNTLNHDAAHAAPSGLRRFAQEISLVVGAALLLFWLIAMVSHDLSDAAWSTTGAGAARAGADLRAACRGIDGGENDQPRIIHHAIGIFERGAERPLQRIADGVMGDIDSRRGRQAVARSQAVIHQ